MGVGAGEPHPIAVRTRLPRYIHNQARDDELFHLLENTVNKVPLFRKPWHWSRLDVQHRPDSARHMKNLQLGGALVFLITLALGTPHYPKMKA
jgi:hypothetical protein